MSADPAGNTRPIPFTDALGERYLAYALSTITSRSLPDVRDGLKPVHRRLVHAMRELGLDPDAAFKKCARVVGDVMGKYHPHGDMAIYDALVRLAQEFAARYPLIEGHGNFGNIDGDNPAAMRYTEARLTGVAEALLEGIDEDSVDFRETYDGEGREPIVLPAAFPNLLANGSQGIAVGMATNIPPHNVGEVCRALLHLIAHPNASDAKLTELVGGPDFPTGGLLVEDQDTIAEAYRTGRGSLRIRARWDAEQLERGMWQAVVTEIPYQVAKGRLLEKFESLIDSRKLPLVDRVTDESAEDVRLVITPRSRTVVPEAMMEQLFRTSELEIRFGLNMNVLDGFGAPRVMSLRECLRAFLDHRLDVLVRRTRHRLERIAHRLEVLEGYLIAYANLDEIIRIIREEDDPKAEIRLRFALTEVQAEAILSMRLRALRKLEEIAIRGEHAGLSEEQKALRALLADEGARWGRVADEVRAMRKRFGDGGLGRRRTEIVGAPPAVDLLPESLVDREPVTVLLSNMHWIRVLKGHIGPDVPVRYKGGDDEAWRLQAHSTDKLLVAAASGRVFTIPVERLPSGKGTGQPLSTLADSSTDDPIVAARALRPEGRLLLMSEDGRGFIAHEAQLAAATRTGRQVMTGRSPLKVVAGIGEHDDCVAIMGENRRMLVLPLAEIPEMVRGRGSRLQSYRDGGVADARGLNGREGLVWRTGERTRREADLAAWKGRRGQAGRTAPHGFPRDNRFGPREA